MLALVVCRNTVFSLGIARALGSMGARCDVMSDRVLPRVRFSRYCRKFVRIDADDFRPEALTRKIDDYCVRNRVDLVIPGDLVSGLALAEIKGRLQVPVFPVASPELLQTLHDKWRFYNLLVSLGLPSPRTRRLEPGGSIDALGIDGPVIAKPPASEGHDRVVKFDTREAFAAMVARPDSSRIPWLVQDFIPGSDIDLSVLASEGRLVAWTIQSDVPPASKLFQTDERVLAIGERILEATKYDGVAHFDMRIDERSGDVFVIECNPRFWGSLPHSIWSGVNFVEMGCCLALGQPLPPFCPAIGLSSHEGFAPRRLLRAALGGHLAPEGMSPASRASWKQMHVDPLPELLGIRAEQLEANMRDRRGVRSP